MILHLSYVYCSFSGEALSLKNSASFVRLSRPCALNKFAGLRNVLNDQLLAEGERDPLQHIPSDMLSASAMQAWLDMRNRKRITLGRSIVCLTLGGFLI